MSTVISVEGLSKKYLIDHMLSRHRYQYQYKTLRDVIGDGFKRISGIFPGPSGAGNEKTAREEFWALQDINFQIQQGDSVGIIGRNGAGKSTLLKILSRITDPTRGRVIIRGRVASLPRSRHGIPSRTHWA